jgi:hypothetical protein
MDSASQAQARVLKNYTWKHESQELRTGLVQVKNDVNFVR